MTKFYFTTDVERTPRHAKIIEKAFSSNRLLSKRITGFSII